MSVGMEIIQKLRATSFNKETERKLQSHPYIKAAEDGTLTLSQRQAFAREQYFVQLSDAASFAALAGHEGFVPSSLTGITVPELPAASEEGDSTQTQPVDLFQFLLGGEIYAASLLLAHAKSVGLRDETSLRSSPTAAANDDDDDDYYQLSPKAQAYPSYWSRLALSNQRAAGAAACAVNFPAWGAMCKRLLEALALVASSIDSNDGISGDGGYNYSGVEDEGLAFIKFFATPIEGLDGMAARIIEEEGVEYEDLVEPVRLLQEYEIMFWDAIFEK